MWFIVILFYFPSVLMLHFLRADAWLTILSCVLCFVMLAAVLLGSTHFLLCPWHHSQWQRARNYNAAPGGLLRCCLCHCGGVLSHCSIMCISWQLLIILMAWMASFLPLTR
jgi:hypothetical protein